MVRASTPQGRMAQNWPRPLVAGGG